MTNSVPDGRRIHSDRHLEHHSDGLPCSIGNCLILSSIARRLHLTGRRRRLGELVGAFGEADSAFQRAENYIVSTWPDNTVPAQVHIAILNVSSYEQAEPTVFAAGGSLIDDSIDHPEFRVYADHIGRPFWLVIN